jgi:hypothetical protein
MIMGNMALMVLIALINAAVHSAGDNADRRIIARLSSAVSHKINSINS